MTLTKPATRIREALTAYDPGLAAIPGRCDLVESALNNTFEAALASRGDAEGPRGSFLVVIPGRGDRILTFTLTCIFNDAPDLVVAVDVAEDYLLAEFSDEAPSVDAEEPSKNSAAVDEPAEEPSKATDEAVEDEE